MRTIYIDADACPVTHIAEGIARRHGIPVTILCDTNHVMYSDYSTVINSAEIGPFARSFRATVTDF